MNTIPNELHINILSFLNNYVLLQFRTLNKICLNNTNFYKNYNEYILNKDKYKIAYSPKSYQIKWRKRYTSFTYLNIKRYYKYNFLVKVKAKTGLNNDFNLDNYIFKAKKNIFSSIWYIYDDKSYIAYIKYCKNKWLLLRPNNEIWCIINIFFKNGNPFKLYLSNINNKNYENPVENQDEHVYKNLKPIKENNKYRMKFSNPYIIKPSIKNFILCNNNSKKSIFEFGRSSQNDFSLCYRSPLHGLFAFACSLVVLSY